MSSKKEEAKKKAAAAAAQAAKQPEPPTPLSKRAKKAAAAQKASSTQVQDGQGPPGKNQPTGAALSSAKPSMPAQIAGHAPRHRPPKEPHGRPHPGKGDSSAPASAAAGLGTTSPPPVTTDNAPGPIPAPGQSQRKNRPVIGLGRQFEAALNGAVVATAPGLGGDRKKRDKGGESVAEGGRGGKGGKHQRREEQVVNVPATVVPSILQRPDVGGGGVAPDGVIVQRAPSPRGTEGPGGHTEGTGGTGGARGGTRRGRGRGRGGHRGG